MINITLLDSSVRTFPANTTIQQIAQSLGSSFSKKVVAAKIDSKVHDLHHSLTHDANIDFITNHCS